MTQALILPVVHSESKTHPFLLPNGKVFDNNELHKGELIYLLRGRGGQSYPPMLGVFAGLRKNLTASGNKINHLIFDFSWAVYFYSDGKKYGGVYFSAARAPDYQGCGSVTDIYLGQDEILSFLPTNKEFHKYLPAVRDLIKPYNLEQLLSRIPGARV